MISPVRFAAVLCLLVAITRATLAAEPPIIARARAQLAPDAVLDAVKSLHYVGTLESEAPADSSRKLTQRIEIFLQKPAQQRIVVTSEVMIEISALDGYDAWRRTLDPSDPTRWQQSQMGSEQIKQLRADVWQNLAFFRGIERIGGRVEDEGEVTIDGVVCRKIAFYHSDDIVYLRYFDAATGKLVYTGTEASNIREQGELVSGGIRFPKSIVITQSSGGRTTRRIITFERITVNEELPPSLFAVPLPTVR